MLLHLSAGVSSQITNRLHLHTARTHASGAQEAVNAAAAGERQLRLRSSGQGYPCLPHLPLHHVNPAQVGPNLWEFLTTSQCMHSACTDADPYGSDNTRAGPPAGSGIHSVIQETSTR